jgi:serine/threonine protein kinase
MPEIPHFSSEQYPRPTKPDEKIDRRAKELWLEKSEAFREWIKQLGYTFEFVEIHEYNSLEADLFHVFVTDENEQAKHLILKVFSEDVEHGRAQAQIVDKYKGKPGFIQQEGHGEVGNAYFVLMPYHGRKNVFEELMGFDDPVSLQTLLAFMKAGRALAFMQEVNNETQRDFKPTNTLIDDNGELLLIDFSLVSSLYNEKRFQYLQPRTSLGFAPPEQLNGLVTNNFDQIDYPKFDQYSFAISIYRFLAGYGQYPFGKVQAAMVRLGERTDNIRPFAEKLRSLLKDYDDLYQPLAENPLLQTQFSSDFLQSIDQVMKKALAKDPQERYETLSEVLDTLEALFKTELERDPEADRQREYKEIENLQGKKLKRLETLFGPTNKFDPEDVEKMIAEAQLKSAQPSTLAQDSDTSSIEQSQTIDSPPSTTDDLPTGETPSRKGLLHWLKEKLRGQRK